MPPIFILLSKMLIKLLIILNRKDKLLSTNRLAINKLQNYIISNKQIFEIISRKHFSLNIHYLKCVCIKDLANDLRNIKLIDIVKT